METAIKKAINDKERKVLAYLAEEYEECAYYFRSIVKHTALELKDVRRACRSLSKKGYAEYRRGLFDDDGMVAGSGYQATRDGALLVRGCIDCKTRIADMVTGQCQLCWETVETKKRLQEMEALDIPTSHLESAKVSLCDLDILKRHYDAKRRPLKLTATSALAQLNKLVKPYQRHYSLTK